MTKEGVLRNNNDRIVVDSMWRDATAEETAEFASLPVLDIDQHQVEYLQTIGDGWANPLKRFMNELELLEVMNMKTITDGEGKRHLLSVPITQSVTAEQKAEFEGKPKIAIKCSAIGSDAVLAVIENPVFFDNRKEEICARTFGCMSQNHPKAQTIFAQGDFLVSGDSMRFV